VDTLGHVYPFVVLAVGLAVVLGGIVLARVNAFLALISAALVVSFMARRSGAAAAADPVTRVAEAFGATAGAIGIVIALAAIIGDAMMKSGAADRIVRGFLDLLGEKRAGTALMTSGYVLSIPVFFDTAFYLLVPLARSLYRTTRRHYLKYLCAIAAGGTATHALVPPTPGPLFVANALDVNLGLAIGMGIVVAVPASLAGLAYGKWLDGRRPLQPSWERAAAAAGHAAAAADARGGPEGAAASSAEPARGPGLFVSLLPIVLPILLIAGDAAVKALAQLDLARADPHARLLRGDELTRAILAAGEAGGGAAGLYRVSRVLGNPSFALLLSAAIALVTLWRRRRALPTSVAVLVETALMSAGVIILITAAGGAFGAMLREAGLGDAIKGLAESAGGGPRSPLGGLPVLGLAFLVSAVIKFAQGSSTTSMIVTSGMMVAMVDPHALAFNAVYLALAIGAGALVGTWMNDSGFWIFAKMGGLSEVEALRSWTVVVGIVGTTGFVVTVLLAWLVPLK
jgi:GntP family gluconate:H+ symporter